MAVMLNDTVRFMYLERIIPSPPDSAPEPISRALHSSSVFHPSAVQNDWYDVSIAPL